MIQTFAVLLLQTLSCQGLGLLLLRKYKYPNLSSLLKLAMALLLGEGVWAQLTMLLGLVGQFTVPWILSLELGFLILSSRLLWREWRDATSQFADAVGAISKSGPAWMSMAVLTSLLAMSGIQSLGKSLMGQDAAAFYLTLPKLIAYAHRVLPLPGYDTFFKIGILGEMNFASLILLGSEDAARLFPWFTLLATVIVLAALLPLLNPVGLDRRKIQLVAAAMLLSSSANLSLLGAGKVDLFAAGFGVACFFWAVQGEWVWTGLFLGFAAVAKISYVGVMVPAVGVIFLWHQFWLEKSNEGFKWRSIFISCSTLALFTFISVAPHMLKSALLCGSAFAPFIGGAAVIDQAAWFGPATARRILLSYPFMLTFADFWAQTGNISPLILASLPWALRLARPADFRKSRLTMLTMGALAGLATWAIFKTTYMAPRYFMAVLLMFVPLAAVALVAATTAPHVRLGIRRFLTYSMLAFTLLILLSNGDFSIKSTTEYLRGRLSICGRDGDACDVASAINAVAPIGARVYQLNWYTYWLRPDLLMNMAKEAERNQLATFKGEEAWKELFAHGFSFIFVDKTSHNPQFNQLGIDNPPDWVRAKVLMHIGNLTAYQLEDLRPPTH